MVRFHEPAPPNGRADHCRQDGARLLSAWAERPRGFDSHPFRYPGTTIAKSVIVVATETAEAKAYRARRRMGSSEVRRPFTPTGWGVKGEPDYGRTMASLRFHGPSPRLHAMKRLELVSWGGGVQSTAIAILVEQGRLPRPDAWLWADTGDEPEAVYEHVQKWQPRLNAIAPFIVVRKGGKMPRLGDAVISKAMKGTGSNTLPFYLPTATGSPTVTPRGCTFNYKREPLDRAAANLVKKLGADGFRWWLGISRDEMQRMKVGMYHPLIEGFDGGWLKPPLTRDDCVRIIALAGETAPRSSCVFCPFRTMHEWSVLSESDRARVSECAGICGV